MGGNVSLDAAALQQKARGYFSLVDPNKDLENNGTVKINDGSGAIFTYKKNAASGEIECFYKLNEGDEEVEVQLSEKKVVTSQEEETTPENEEAETAPQRKETYIERRERIAREVFSRYPEGTDFSNGVLYKDPETGEEYTFKLNSETDEIKCSYSGTEESTNEIIFDAKVSMTTNKGKTAVLTEGLANMAIANGKTNYYTGGGKVTISAESATPENIYAASDEAIEKREELIDKLNDRNRKVRRAAQKELKALDIAEYEKAGFTRKTAKKFAKEEVKDARAGDKSAKTTVFLTKAERKAAEKEQDAAEKRVKEARKAGKEPDPKDLELVNQFYTRVKDKDVREYIETHKDAIKDSAGNVLHEGFYEDGKFSSDNYKEIAHIATQGDNTLTTTERPAVAAAMGISQRDGMHMVRDANFATQPDHTMKVELAKTAVSIALSAFGASLLSRDIHSVESLSDKITIVADKADPCKYVAFLDGVSVAEATSEVFVHMTKPAIANAVLGALITKLVDNPWTDPKGKIKADRIETAVRTAQNIFRGRQTAEISGELVVGKVTQPVVTVPIESYNANIFATGDLDCNGEAIKSHNVNAQRTGKVDGPRGNQYKGHLWNALCAAYGINYKDSKAAAEFRKFYRDTYFGGANKFYDNKHPVPGFCINYKGEQIPFNEEAFNNTWDFYYLKDGNGRAGNVRSAQVAVKQAEYWGNSGYNVQAGQGSFETGHLSSATAVRSSLTGQAANDQTLNDAQRSQHAQAVNNARIQWVTKP